MIPEEEPAPHGEQSAERRARRAWLGDAALLRRAEAAEASVGALETQLAERELELRRVKQREYAEQQLRVEAEEVSMRARRGRREELDRWQRRVDAAHAATLRVEAQRDALAARLTAVNASAVRLGAGIQSLHTVAAELRRSFEHDRAAARARIRELEAQLESRPAAAAPPAAAVPPAAPRRSDAEEAQRREEMASALAAAVTRLRSRAAATEPADTPPAAREPEPQAVSSEVSTMIVVPRLFVGKRRPGGRLAPLARRMAARLTHWADRAQGRPR